MSAMDFMGGGAAPPDMGAPAPPPDMGAPAPEASSVSSPPSGEPIDNLRQAIDLITEYMLDEQDDEDLAIAAKIKADIQKLLANNQKLADQAMGMGPGAKYIRKQNAGAGAGY